MPELEGYLHPIKHLINWTDQSLDEWNNEQLGDDYWLTTQMMEETSITQQL